MEDIIALIGTLIPSSQTSQKNASIVIYNQTEKMTLERKYQDNAMPEAKRLFKYLESKGVI